MSDELVDEEESVLPIVNAWYDEFAASPEFGHLAAAHQSEAGAIIEFFAEYAHQHLGAVPKTWTAGDVRECCTEILPRKVSAKRSFFEAMEPVLSAFFTFLGNKGLQRNGHSLAKVTKGLSNQIIAISQDRSHWGPAKRLVMEALDEGVDIADEAALQTYMLERNLRTMERLEQEEKRSSRLVSSNPFSPPPPPRQQLVARPKGGRYDPCPCGSGKKYKFCGESKFALDQRL